MTPRPSVGFAPALMTAPARAETGAIDMTRQTPDPDQLARLRELLPPGTTVYCILRHVSRSGMSRRISLLTWRDGQPYHMDDLMCLAFPDRFRQRAREEGIVVHGCGMDMGFALVYDLAQCLYPDGFECIGTGCPSNAHTNGDRDYTPHHHSSGGYALKHCWL